MSVARDLCAGTAAGLVATLPMTAVMEGVRRLLPRHQQDPIPPRQITERATESAGVADDMTEGEKDAATAASHLAFGTGTGAVYGLAAPHLPLGPVASGVGYGLSVWACSYLGWLPATGLYKHPRHEPAGRHADLILSHVVWGLALGLLHRGLTGTPERPEKRRDTASAEVLAAARATAV